MANKNYTQMSSEELLDELKSVNGFGSLHFLKILRNHHSELLNELLERTKFLSPSFYKGNVVPIQARIYCIGNGIVEQPICNCPTCNNQVKWRSDLHTFATYCSMKCMFNDEQHWEHMKNTLLERYGVDNPGLSPEVQAKMRKTCLETYGAEYAIYSTEVRKKIFNTNIERHGVSYPFQSSEILEKTRNTCERKYGSKCMFDTPYFREVVNERFGTEWYSQSDEYHRSRRHKFFHSQYPGITFDSTWEFKVYDFLSMNKFKFEFQPASIPYMFEGVEFRYHPDFLVDGRLFEVKGDHFFRINEATGKEEMFCPFRNPNWTDEEYDWKCRQYEAKHQCMLRNNVRILRDSDISNLSISLFTSNLESGII